MEENHAAGRHNTVAGNNLVTGSDVDTGVAEIEHDPTAKTEADPPGEPSGLEDDDASTAVELGCFLHLAEDLKPP